MAERLRKPPGDSIALAKMIGDVATGQKSGTEPDRRSPAAVAVGRLGGLKGGPAHAKPISAERRSEVAELANKRRWSGKRKNDN